MSSLLLSEQLVIWRNLAIDLPRRTKSKYLGRVGAARLSA